MNPAEYEIMRTVEDRHWWYQNLHMLVEDALRRHLPETALPVLDAGCGTGALAARLQPCYRMVGLDYSPLALTFTRERGISNLIRGSVSHLPFANAKFAAVVSLDVIIHRSAGPPAASIAEFARVTAPGGYVILNVPAYEWLRSPHDEQVQTARRFERAELLNLIDSAELELVHSTHWNSLLMPPIVAARFLKRALRSTASDLTDFRPGTGATICGAVMGVERALLRAMPLPFGVSIFAIARKPA